MQLHTTLHGTESAPLVTFCHGLFGQGKNWTATAKGLATATPPWRSLLIDMPNHGRSEWTEHVEMADWADAVAETIAAHASTTHLVGHSMGGKIAMLLALRHPELVRSLTIVDVAPVGYRLGRSFHRYIEAMQAIDLRSLSGRDAADEALREAVPDPVIRSFLLQNLRRTSDDPQPWRWQMNLSLLGDELDRVGEWSDPEGRYDGPVLWIRGAESDYITEAAREPMLTLFPTATLVTIKNAGHWVHSEQPEVFASVLHRFLHANR